MSKVNNFLKSFTLKLKNQHSFDLVHLYADYAELIAIVSNENYFSTSDFLDRLTDEGINIPNVSDNNRASENDKREAFGVKVFNVIEERIEDYGSDYPIEIYGGRIKVKTSLTERNKVYILLLLASNLDIFNDFNTELTSDFEIISTITLKNYLPSYGEVRSLGSNSDYSGNTITKIRELAKEMCLEVDEIGIDQINKKANKEKGVDIVGWLPPNDMAGNMTTYLCQCACGKGWYMKQNETKRYQKYLKFNCLLPLSVMFIPYSLVSNGISNFFQFDEIHEQLIFERSRVMKFLKDFSFYNDLNALELVNSLIKYEEDIV